MLTFFRINTTILHVISLLVILIAIRFPYYGHPLPMLTTELECMLVGQKLNEGLKLYSGILTQIAPLSSYFYKLMNLWFGKSQFYYELVASLIIYAQVLFFVFIVNKRNLFNEKNYVSGLFFLIMISISFDLNKLSPSLLANFFLLGALNVILRQVEKRNGVGEDIFEAGLFIGIATLFHLPAAIFIIWATIGLLLYSTVNIRQILMVILAFLMPIFFTYLIFYFNNHGSEYLTIWLLNWRNTFDLSLLGIKDILITYLLPFILAFFGLVKVLQGTRYNSFQTRSHQMLIIYGIFALISLFLSQNFTPSNLVFITPFIAFFGAGFFIHSKKRFLPEILLLLFIILTMGVYYLGVTGRYISELQTLNKFRISDEPLPEKFQNKKVFITGEHIDAYKTNDMATGYMSWKLAKEDFKRPNNYVSLVSIYNNLKKDYPEVIIDKENVMPAVFKNIPSLGDKYTKVDKNIYQFKN